MKRVEEEGRDLVSALTCLAAAAGFHAGFLVLAVRLAEVQISDSAAYGYANARQSVRRVQTDGPRGRILDRNQRVLADNVVVRSVVCLPERFQRRSWDATVQEIMCAIEAVGKAITHIRCNAAPMSAAWKVEIDEDFRSRESDRR